MHISFLGRYHNCGDSTLVNTDISFAGRCSPDELYYDESTPVIKVDETGLVVLAATKPNPNSHMAGSYVVKVRLTETEIANLAVALWGSESLETVIDALSGRTERGKKIAQIERWRRKAAEAPQGKDRNHAEKMLRRSVDQLTNGTAASS